MSIQTDELEAKLKAEIEIDQHEKTIRGMKLKLDRHRYSEQLKKLEVYQSENALVETIDLQKLDESYFIDSANDYEKYIAAAEDSLEFILPEFRDIPFFSGNLLFFGGGSGTKGAKTHTAVEIAYSVLNQKSKKTGHPCKVLYLTNEETAASITGRIAFRWKNWVYTDLANISEDQKKFVFKFQKTFFKKGQLVVIDDNLPRFSKATSSIEGIESILSSLKKNENDFDCIIIDYFHKINSSKVDPSESDVNVLTRVCDRLDYHRKFLNCPIVVMGQLHPKTPDKDDFESRIKGRKRIIEASTFVAEIKPDLKTRVTTFVIEKNRLKSGTVTNEISVGYSTAHGKYIPINSPEFATQRLANENKLEAEKEAELKIKLEKRKN